MNVSIDASIDASFVQRISTLESHLLEPIIDRSTLATFNHQWMAFANDLQAAIDAGRLSISTISMSHALADRISGVIQTFSDLDALSEDLLSSLVLEASSILSSPTHSTTSTSPGSTDSDNSNENHLIQCGSPAYIQPSYKWLLGNIHDPYPSSRIRDNIARQTSSSRKDIDGWFVDARKRIGWNELRKTRFSNKRAEIVDAATRFFLEDDPKRPLDPDIELKFAAIETRAKDLYSEKFSESLLATKLDKVVKDMTPEMKAMAKEEEGRRILLQMAEEDNTRISQAISSYPSPDRTPNRTPMLDLPSVIANGDDVVSVSDESTSSRKRRCSSSDSSDYSIDRPNKRSRLETPSFHCLGVPSPAPSVHEVLDDSPSNVTSASSDSLVSTVLSRKRRSSDADVQGAPKRPRNLPVGPRLHAISNPLPMSSAIPEASFDDWYKEHFERPNIASVDELDPSIPLEVEFCDTSVFNDSALRQCLSDSDAASYIDTPGYTIPSSTSSSSLPLETSTHPFDVFRNEFDFRDLAANHFTDIFQGQGIVDNHGFSLSFDIPPLDLDFPLNAFDPYIMPLPTQNTMSVLPDLSAYVPAKPSSDVNWPLSQLLPSLPPFQDTVSSNDKVHDTFNLFPPEDFSFDLGILNQAQSNDDIVNTTLVERAAKEKQLLEFKEAARRLEEELAASQ